MQDLEALAATHSKLKVLHRGLLHAFACALPYELRCHRSCTTRWTDRSQVGNTALGSSMQTWSVWVTESTCFMCVLTVLSVPLFRLGGEKSAAARTRHTGTSYCGASASLFDCSRLTLLVQTLSDPGLRAASHDQVCMQACV